MLHSCLATAVLSAFEQFSVLSICFSHYLTNHCRLIVNRWFIIEAQSSFATTPTQFEPQECWQFGGNATVRFFVVLSIDPIYGVPLYGVIFNIFLYSPAGCDWHGALPHKSNPDLSCDNPPKFPLFSMLYARLKQQSIKRNRTETLEQLWEKGRKLDASWSFSQMVFLGSFFFRMAFPLSNPLNILRFSNGTKYESLFCHILRDTWLFD